MSSNWATDPSEHLHRLLSQYQQYSSSSAQRQQTASGVLPTPAMAPTPPTVIQGLGSLLASYQQQSIEGVAGANITAPAASTWSAPGDVAQGILGFQAQVQPQHQLEAPRPASAANVNGAALGQHILASAQLLSAFNPGLAAAAIAQALNLNSQQSVQQQPQQQLPPSQLQSQPNQFKTSLESVYQQLQKQISNPSASPVTDQGVVSLGFPSNSATTLPASNVNSFSLSQMSVAQSDMTEQDTRSAVKNATTLPLSLHCLNQGMPSHAATASRSNACPPLNLSAQNWTLEQLESHAKQLQDSHQPIPQSIAILLASARRKEEKQKAKKLANRKSAFSSRVRKKAKIDAMAEENIRLKREATILSFLPDPVVAIGIGGEITFCSRQMERVLQNKAVDLIGENVENLIAPDSWGELRRMVEDVVTAHEKATLEEQEDITRLANAIKQDSLSGEKKGVNNSASGNPSASSTQSSEQSFPMLEVEVDSCENVSGPSGYCLKKSSKESKQTVSTNDYYPEANDIRETEMYNPPSKKSHQDRQQESCLNHKYDLRASPSSSPLTVKQGYKSPMSTDSSLSKTKDRPSASNPSEDSGYRESNDSQESNESSSSSVNTTEEDDVNLRNEVRRVSPLAPSCYVRLIRNDLRTLWCELTASIHPINISDGDVDLDGLSRKPKMLNEHQKSTHDSSSFTTRLADFARPDEKMKELLLCFRPFREGPKVGEELRFRKTVVAETPKESERLSDYMNESSSSSSGKKSNPPQKRKFISDEEEVQEGQR